ncbi:MULTISPECIES: hypothetical protein [Candidatus Nitrosocaldus]|uniref:Uncharacterized protein n=1 Tax=Candidatus Nitrosocaldus cavascurensis TaxID=2058097 RepID=A0A2K5ATK6_9ARCH|nr:MULTISPECIES: hypothetical protein [Candidatus Nitrosocaldus]GBC74314.1 hypothetical protein HRbin05_00352 [archaeon HR05]SPC34963.1 conserved protein of unknown function [Candidatus Nitrosocaldus cavascurensis]
MARKKVKIELEDSEGSKYSIVVEGNLTREKVLKVFEMMNLLDDSSNEKYDAEEPNSLGERIMHLIEEEFPYGEFTSSQVLEAYEDRYNEPIKLSMVSTYLARFTSKGILARNRSGREWRYKRVLLKH